MGVCVLRHATRASTHTWLDTPDACVNTQDRLISRYALHTQKRFELRVRRAARVQQAQRTTQVQGHTDSPVQVPLSAPSAVVRRNVRPHVRAGNTSVCGLVPPPPIVKAGGPVSYTHLRAHET